MEQIKGITFAPFPYFGVLSSMEARDSLTMMMQCTEANCVLFALTGLQNTPQSEEIDFESNFLPSDLELKNAIHFAQSLGLKVILKPTVNCKNGVWRAFINFFDNEVPCEPKWRNWFHSYKQFQLHYAQIAEETHCFMFIMGCEMVMAERKEAEWRDLTAEVKSIYHGYVSYNTDKYQEDHVTWWDCVDVISSSGYYPIGSWKTELDRIEQVVYRFNKPFFFAETGCMSVTGSAYVPNKWELTGEANMIEQARWYEDMFEHTQNRPWVNGYCLWSWPARLYSENNVLHDKSYSFYAKDAETVVRRYFSL
ncbi:MAG: hypothetical protein LBQ77_06280 [Treponema sp.]|jgi:hypothetical protein|nr:hypothetical protein [Treponema sp.]